MRQELKEIKPGYGLGSIKFGMTRDEVRAVLGEPDEIDSFSDSDNEDERTETWYYYELELSVAFDEEEDWRLFDISVSSDFYTFMEQHPIGMNREALLSLLGKLNYDDLTFEDHSSDENPDHELIEVDSVSMSFWVLGGVVDEVEIMPEFIDDDTIKWPE